jgi:hypothetical protein
MRNLCHVCRRLRPARAFRFSVHVCDDCERAPQYVTGDGVSHYTREAAFRHADSVAARTGQIIAIESAL